MERDTPPSHIPEQRNFNKMKKQRPKFGNGIIEEKYIYIFQIFSPMIKKIIIIKCGARKEAQRSQHWWDVKTVLLYLLGLGE